MKRSPTARDVARRVLGRVERKGAYATLALAAELTQLANPEERALATELTYGVLRNRSRLDRALGSFAEKGLHKLHPRVLDALRVAAYQVLFLRVPAYAAVDDAVTAIKRVRAGLAPLGNALLRKLAERGEPPLPTDPLEALLVEESCPRWIYDAFEALLGAEEAAPLVRALRQPPPVGVRAVGRTREEVAALLLQERPSAEIVPSALAPEALLVRAAGPLHETQAFRAGWLTLQDPAAQLAAHLLEPRPGERILDACAGVGGKSTHLAQLAGTTVRIDAVDRAPQKLALLREQAKRLALPGIHIFERDLLADDALRDLGPYDAALLDAPCTGLGVLRRHPEAKWSLAPTDPARMASLGASLLDRVAGAVRPGGRLVFAVCTLTVEEGPRQIESFLARHPEWSTGGPARLVLPHRDEADGFFLARLKRGPQP